LKNFWQTIRVWNKKYININRVSSFKKCYITNVIQGQIDKIIKQIFKSYNFYLKLYAFFSKMHTFQDIQLARNFWRSHCIYNIFIYIYIYVCIYISGIMIKLKSKPKTVSKPFFWIFFWTKIETVLKFYSLQYRNRNRTDKIL